MRKRRELVEDREQLIFQPQINKKRKRKIQILLSLLADLKNNGNIASTLHHTTCMLLYLVHYLYILVCSYILLNSDCHANL